MKQQLAKKELEEDFAEDMLYELPKCSFKFCYLQAIDPDYVEKLVEELNNE